MARNGLFATPLAAFLRRRTGKHTLKAVPPLNNIVAIDGHVSTGAIRVASTDKREVSKRGRS